MKIKEFRIVMPLTLDEFQRGQTYTMCEMSRRETGGGDGVEILLHEPFQDKSLLDDGRFHQGRYTFKKYFMKRKVNSFVRSFAPKGSLVFEEKAWNAFPYCRTVITNEAYMKDNFEIRIESLHIDNDKGEQENVHQLDEDALRMRQVVFVDIADRKSRRRKQRDQEEEEEQATEEDIEEENETENESEEIGESICAQPDRGPLEPNWKDRSDIPFMCCYKLVTVKFKWMGLQTIVEDMILANQRKLFQRFHTDIFCWMDKWRGLTEEDLESLMAKTIEELKSRRNSPLVRGTGME